MMDQGLSNLVQLVGLSLEDASLTASLVPARSLGVDQRKGKVEPGRDADLVVLDDDYRVVMTVGRGEVLWEKEQASHHPGASTGDGLGNGTVQS